MLLRVQIPVLPLTVAGASHWTCEPQCSHLWKAVPANHSLMESPGGWVVKNLPAMQKTKVWSLHWENPCSKKWQPTPVFLPGKSQGQRSLAGHSSWSHRDLETRQYQSLTYFVILRIQRETHFHGGFSWVRPCLAIKHYIRIDSDHYVKKNW